jgi:hypothetical protein
MEKPALRLRLRKAKLETKAKLPHQLMILALSFKV